MIVWLASYPRSGNTLIRMLLRRVFGIASTSEYLPASIPDGTDGDPAFAGTAVGEARAQMMQKRKAEGIFYSYPGALEEFLAESRSAAERVYVKTHGTPRDQSPAIYIVRDGRAVLASYRRFHSVRLKGAAPPLADFILGKDAFVGSWSGHLSSWQPLTRPGTLLLRFEDLVARPRASIRAIADFLGLEPRNARYNPKAEVASLDPILSRGGSNALNLAEFTPEDEALFWELHGAWMERLGYRRAPRADSWWRRRSRAR